MIRNSLPFTLRSLRERGRGRKWRVHRSWIIFWTTIFTFYRATFTQVVCAHFGGCQLPPFSEAVRRSWKGFEGVNVHTALHGCMVNQQNSRDSEFWRNGEWYSGTSYLDFFWTLSTAIAFSWEAQLRLSIWEAEPTDFFLEQAKCRSKYWKPSGGV